MTRTGAALRLQPLAAAGGHGRSARYGSRFSCSSQVPCFVAAAQVRDEPFEAGAERIRRRAPSSSSRLGSRPPARRAVPARRRRGRRAIFFGSRRNGIVRSMPNVRLSVAERFLDQLAVALAPTARSRRPASDSDSSGTTRAGSKSYTAPSPWQSWQAPCGELNEKARGVISGMLTPHYVQASRRENRRSPPSSVLMTTMSSARLRAISTDSVSRRSMPGLRIRRSTTTSIVWLRRRSSLMSSSSERSWPSTRTLVKPRARSAGELLLELALPAAHDRRQHVDALVVRRQHHHVDDALERLRGDLAAAEVAVRHADVGEQQPQVVVDLGDGADRRARVRAGRLLLDRDGRRQAVDEVDVRLLHLLEELAGVGRQRLDVAALSFGVDRVEGERRLARPRQAGDDDQLVAREVDVDILEVVDARAAHRNPVVRHVGGCVQWEISQRSQNCNFSTGLAASRQLPRLSRASGPAAGRGSLSEALSVSVRSRLWR